MFFIMRICYQTLGSKNSLVGHRLDNSWYFILKRTHIWMPFQRLMQGSFGIVDTMHFILSTLMKSLN